MRIIKLCLSLLIIYSLVIFNKVRFDNGVNFSGDGWEYQSMAVNYARGYGLMKVGGMAGDYHQDYKFYEEIDEVYQPTLKRFVEFGEKGGKDHFYRTPGYVLFLGGIYKLFGLNPEVVKKIQLLLIIITAAFLPYIGFFYWRLSGFVAGVIGGIIYLQKYARNIPKDFALSYPSQFMTEGLVAFGLFLLVIVWINWERKKNARRAWWLGIVTGINLLIKGTNIFLPLIIAIYLWSLLIRKKITKANLLGFILGVLMSVLPWSYYASKISGKIIILSTQSEAVLLDNNNEYAIDGGWHPEGNSQNPDLFYNQPKIKSLSLPAKLIVFYTSHLEMIPDVFLAKIRLGFENHLYFKTALLLIELRLTTIFVFNLLKKKKIKTRKRILNIMLVLIGLAIICGKVNKLWLMGILRPFLYADLLLIYLILIIVGVSLIDKRAVKIDLPMPFGVVSLNYLLLTMVTLGWPRLNQVADFTWMLLTCQYALDYLKFLGRSKASILSND